MRKRFRVTIDTSDLVDIATEQCRDKEPFFT